MGVCITNPSSAEIIVFVVKRQRHDCSQLDLSVKLGEYLVLVGF